MAEGGVSKDDHGYSVVSGSEFVFDFYCEVCRDDDRHEEADGYCQDCGEFLCNLCITAHKRSRPTRRHDVLNKDSMPMDTPLSQDRVSKDISTKCQSHKDVMVSFYCLDHDTLGCSTCFATVHRKCAEIESVHEKSGTILESKEFNDFASSLKHIGERSRDIIHKCESEEQTSSDAISSMKMLRNINECIILFATPRRLEDSMDSSDNDNIERLKKSLTEIATEAETLREEFDGLVKSKRLCQLYVRMKEKTNDVLLLENRLKRIETSHEVQSIESECKRDIGMSDNDNIEHLNSKPGDNGAEVGNIDNDTTAANDANNKIPIYVCDVDIRSSNDSNDCCIRGSIVLSDASLVAVDSSNSSVKLVDIGSNKLVNELSLPAQPFDVTMVSKKQVAVSTWDKSKIFLINVKRKLSLKREIPVARACRGVTFFQDKLLVTFSDNPRLEIMDLRGNILKTLAKHENGYALFGNPGYVCLSKDGDSMYVSDGSVHGALRVTFDGKVTANYRGLIDPNNLCIDNDGNIYIAGGFDRTVNMITADWTKAKVALSHEDGLDKWVKSVSHCKRTNRLFVGFARNDTIKVYQLS